MIDSVLVANRGEIAVRILKTCHRLGIRSVAVYSDVDAHTLHVLEADSAIRIGPPPAAESYLNATAIIRAAHQSRVDAIHPGYGFLAENPAFAQTVIDAGLTWIGPPPDAMRALGDKSHAKLLAQQNDVPTLAGYHAEDQSLEVLRAQAERIGFPLLIKASAGGGGRGMRVVESASAFDEALEAAKREARASFGDDRVLLERYLPRPRHVEIQIFGDQHGNFIHLGERECSIQRRHQKLIEESPSPAVDDELRGRMGEASLRLARAAGYTNAGTVEFLLDENRQFAFLEVNARLQVEHPVTEAVTGLDLVELQLRVASGEPLQLQQSDVKLDGHAIEARVIAEDPQAGFLPSSGRVEFEQLEHPQFVRIDTWISNGTVVSPYYDSLLAKVIAHDVDRAAAARRIAHALQEVRILGIRHNVDLLLATVESPEFLRGEVHTRFLEDHRLVEGLAEVPAEVVAAVSAVDSLCPPNSPDPWLAQTGWRLGRIDQPASWSRAGRTHVASVSMDLGGRDAIVDVEGRQVRVGFGSVDGALARVSVDGLGTIVWDHNAWRVVEWQGRSYHFERTPAPTIEETARDRGAGGGAGQLTAPMPGRVVKISVEDGSQVSPRQPLIVLEAMKMEHVIEAPHAGVVANLSVRVGDQVIAGAPLLTISSVE